MKRIFLDSNVLIYSVKLEDERRATALTLLRDGGTIGVQCLNEFAAVAHRKLGMSWTRIATLSRDFVELCGPVHPLTIEVHQSGLELADRYRLSCYDAMIVAAALVSGCHRLYSEDMHDGRVINGQLRIENPFKSI
ncbi:PIN domain-containing protein [Sphingomonas sp. DT-204]|uniref:PIN domain-containing protein n=1 Tax=Sphingomonas sp. DT-204 TaxID=3396166 RepID=UPI003F1DCB0D